MYKMTKNKLTLAESNPYLKYPVIRKKMIEIFAMTSTAIEGVNAKRFKRNSAKKNYKKYSISKSKEAS